MPEPSRATTARSRAAPLAALLATVAETACAGAAPAPTPGPPGIVFPASFALSGSVSVSGTFTDRASANTPTGCAQFATAGIRGVYFIPFPARGNRLNGQPFEYQSVVTGYHGPGDYSDVHDIVQITVDDGVFVGDEGSTLALTSRPDGSGSVSFTRFVDVNDSARRIAGRIEWTCSPASPS